MHKISAAVRPRPAPRLLAAVLALLTALAFATVAASPAQAETGSVGVVFTQTNDPNDNELVVYDRFADGTLTERDRVSTGGMGTGAGLGSQGAVILHLRFVFVVNAGSDTISSFSIGPDNTPILVDEVPSFGDMPTSLTVHNRLLYVLNAAEAGSIHGYRIRLDGSLQPLSRSGRPLSGNNPTAPAQISFTPDGRQLIVTERATNLITRYNLGPNGRTSLPMSEPSEGETPFGFDFVDNRTFIVSEAFGGAPDASTVTSYRRSFRGGLVPISPEVATTETAACWVEVTKDGRFAYTTNTGSGTITGLAIGPDGSVSLLDPDGVTAFSEGSAPLDLDDSRDGRYLYVLRSGTGQVGGYIIESDGALTPIPAIDGLPSSAAGLAAS